MLWTDLAQAQGGVIARRQLNVLGHGDRSVNGMLYRGRLVVVTSASVYRVAGAAYSEDGARWAAVLATKSPLSYTSAAFVWGVEVPNDGQIHVTRFDRRRLSWPPGVRIHRVALDPIAVTERQGMPITTRTETLLDCLGWLQPGAASALADRAKQQRWLRTRDLEQRLATQPGRWGNRRLKWLLPMFGDDADSVAERKLHRLLSRARITGWSANVPVAVGGRRYVIDVAFADQLLAIEVDGFSAHSSHEAFQRDRTKQGHLTAAGWTVLRFTWSDLVERPDYVLATITTLLAGSPRIRGIAAKSGGKGG